MSAGERDDKRLLLSEGGDFPGLDLLKRVANRAVATEVSSKGTRVRREMREFSPEEIETMRARMMLGESVNSLAESLGVTYYNVSSRLQVHYDARERINKRRGKSRPVDAEALDILRTLGKPKHGS